MSTNRILSTLLPTPRTTLSGNINIPSPSDAISEFSPLSLDLLTQLLSLPAGVTPNPPWHQDQATLISTFPPCLLHPKSSGLISRVAASISSLRLGETGAILCSVHKPLNPYLIRKIFLEVTAECTARIERLVSASASPSTEYKLPAHIQQFTLRMQRLNSLWMTPDLYRQAYQATPSDPRYERVASGCEACILASIGGNREIIRDLYASVLGRRRKGKVMEGWIDVIRAWGSWQGNFEAVTMECAGLGHEIGRVRKRLQKMRKEARRREVKGKRWRLRNASANLESPERASEQTLLGRPSFQEDEEEQVQEQEEEQEEKEPGRENGDIENEIVDFYANMISRTSLVSTPSTTATTTTTTLDQATQPAENIHPAFRNTMIYTSSGFFQNITRPVPSPSIYSRSVYNSSQSSLHAGQPHCHSHSRSQERASTYRQLVGIEEDGGDYQSEGEEGAPEFTDPFADPAVSTTSRHRNAPAYRGRPHERALVSPEPASPRTTRHEYTQKPTLRMKPAPGRRLRSPKLNPFTRKSHVVHAEGKPEGSAGKPDDRDTRFSDFMK